MPKRKFYEIKPKAYIFSQEKTDKKRNTPEEKVRQWVIFELLSVYGVSINDINIEVPAKIGSNYYYADIVVCRQGSPFVVVECKKLNGNTTIEEALKQAISYANFLNADFVVYTDGVDWVVKRKLSNQWYVISDIPNETCYESKTSLVDMLKSYTDLKPILYWMNKSVPAKYSKEFLYYVHRFFCEHVHSIPPSLWRGTEHLLRVVGNGKRESTKFAPDGYEDSKLRIAYEGFADYFKEIKFADEVYSTHDPAIYNFKELVDGLQFRFEGLVERQHSLEGVVFLVVRLVVAVLNYLQQISASEDYEDIPLWLMKEIQNLVDIILITKFGVRLPDSLDRNGTEFLSVYCSERWNEHYLTTQNGAKS